MEHSSIQNKEFGKVNIRLRPGVQLEPYFFEMVKAVNMVLSVKTSHVFPATLENQALKDRAAGEHAVEGVARDVDQGKDELSQVRESQGSRGEDAAAEAGHAEGRREVEYGQRPPPALADRESMLTTTTLWY
jgi:hypothetical protein